MIKKTIFVTFPRSGHHLVTNVLFKYFSKNINYPEIKGDETRLKCRDVIKAGELNYCEFYHHCKAMPCPNFGTNIQKSHDFNLDLTIDNNYRYLILYRQPVEAISSWYELLLREPFLNSLLGKYVDYSRRSWEDFSKDALIFWKKFINKWVDKTPANFKLLMSYAEIVERPIISFVNIIKFIDPDSVIDFQLLSKCIEGIDIKEKSEIRTFRHFSEKFFSELEKDALPEIKKAGLYSKFH